jgi:hypothetical protein
MTPTGRQKRRREAGARIEALVFGEVTQEQGNVESRPKKPRKVRHNVDAEKKTN